MAAAHGASLRVVECVCSDEEIHRSRVEGRIRGIPGWDELDWKFVKVSRTTYQPLDVEKVVVDAVDTIAVNLARVRAHLGLGKPVHPDLGNNAGNQGETQ